MRSKRVEIPKADSTSLRNLRIRADTVGIAALQSLLHRPKCAVIGGPQLASFMLKACPYPLLRVIVILLPSVEQCLANAEQARAVHFKILPESAIE